MNLQRGSISGGGGATVLAGKSRLSPHTSTGREHQGFMGSVVQRTLESPWPQSPLAMGLILGFIKSHFKHVWVWSFCKEKNNQTPPAQFGGTARGREVQNGLAVSRSFHSHCFPASLGMLCLARLPWGRCDVLAGCLVMWSCWGQRRWRAEVSQAAAASAAPASPSFSHDSWDPCSHVS